MKRLHLKKALSLFVSLTLVAAFALPSTALAAKPEVEIDNHTTAGLKTLSQIRIDDVDAPQVGKALDDTAEVSSAEGETWDIPVLWVGDDLKLATEAVEGRTYLPALAFFVPQGCTIDGSAFTVTLSDSLVKLFGTEDVVSVYDANTGITYILPASLRDFFTAARTQAPAAGQAANAGEPAAEPAAEQAAEQAAEPASDQAAEPEEQKTLVEIFCAQTARDEFSDEDLEWLINFVRNVLQPQAVNLLIDRFPAFASAAQRGEIGKEIGFYVYYKKGDDDGVPEHEVPSNVLAYVAADVDKKDDMLKYCYLIGLDVNDLVLLDGNKAPVRDPATGKLKLVRSGTPLITLNNTIVHEMFHAFMDDYNRPGTSGARNTKEGYTPGGNFINPEQKRVFNALKYPKWFSEGTASAVENVHQFRYLAFRMLRAKPGSWTEFEDTFTNKDNTLLYNYLNAQVEGEYLYFDIVNSSSNNNNEMARYVTGYLATLYLCQLASQKNPSIGSASSTDGTNTTFSSEKLCLGLNWILERMHNGETLDSVIKDISTINGQPPLYTSTDDFTNKFIKGALHSDQKYYGDDPSIAFTCDYLNYFLRLENTPNRTFKPNGSILFDFDQDFDLPLDPNKEATSDFYRIIYSNVYTPSTASNGVAYAGGGKSDPNTVSSASLGAASSSGLPLAAKAGTGEAGEAGEATDATTTDMTAGAPDGATADMTAGTPDATTTGVAANQQNTAATEGSANSQDAAASTNESADGTTATPETTATSNALAAETTAPEAPSPEA